MLSIGLVRSAGDAARYYEKDDYYAPDPAAGEGVEGREGGDVQGQWGGRGAAALGLTGSVDKAQFGEMLSGHLPNGIVLGRRKDGEIQHTPGWDLTFSAPKSVSILVEIGGDERLRAAHDRAVETALQWVEHNALGTRQRTSEGQVFEGTGSMVVARFTHHTSRNQDPSLHTHSVVMNATEDAQGTWRSLHSIELFRNKMVAGQIYRSELAREALALGYSLEVHGKGGTFELREIPESYRQALSTRRAQVGAWLRDRGLTGSELAAKAALYTRPSKKDTPHRELQERWREAASLRGIDPDSWRQDAEARGPTAAPEGLQIDEAVREAKERAAEPEAVFGHGELLRHALRLTLGRAGIDEAESAVRTAAHDKELIRADDGDQRRWTTPRARFQEQRAIEAVLGSTSKPVTSRRAAAMAAGAEAYLTTGQREAVKFTLGSDAQFKAVLGRPGAGKTTMMAVVARAAEKHGWQVRGMAQNAAAAKNLETEAGIRSSTIHKLLREIGPELVRIQRGEVHWWERIMQPREIWVVDEASQLPNSLLSRLIWAAKAKEAQVLFVGDNKQLSPIEAGRPFDLLLEKGMKHVEMDQILRQRNPEDLTAIRAVIDGNVRGALEQLGERIKTLEDRKARLAAMVRQWAEKPEHREGTLLLTSRHEDRRILNEAVRDVLRKEGKLVGERSRATLEKVSGLRADTREIHHYRVGQVLHFPAEVHSLGILADEYLRVQQVDLEKGLATLLREGEKGSIEWDPRRDAPRKQFPVAAYESRSTTLAAGEQVRWLRNSREYDLKNGELLTVKALGRDSTTFQRANGATIVVDTSTTQGQHWTHAYASTVYRSQGQTAQRTIVNLDSSSGKLLSQKAFLVAISRHRDELSIYADSRSELLQRLERQPGDKTSAVAELERHKLSRSALLESQSARKEHKPEFKGANQRAMRGMER